MPVMWLNCASVTNTDKHISARYVLSCVCVCVTAVMVVVELAGWEM